MLILEETTGVPTSVIATGVLFEPATPPVAEHGEPAASWFLASIR
jgi:hypothetical protein